MGIKGALEDYSAPTPAKLEPHPLPGGLAAIDSLVQACNGNDEHILLVILLGRMGLRVAEALDVTPADFRYSNMTLLVHGKGQKDRIVPVPEDAWRLIQNYVITSALKRGPKNKLINYRHRSARKVITRLGVVACMSRRIASHDLRMTFGTDALNRCGNIRTVQELLGHASVTTTEGYTYVSMDDMRAAVARAIADEESDDD